MLLAAASLTAAIYLEIDLGSLFKAQQQNPDAKVTCGIRTVGYRFWGKPGQTFQYAGDRYTIPEEGWIELIADRRKTTYRVHNQSLPLENLPLNQFGFGEVTLPAEKEITR